MTKRKQQTNSEFIYFDFSLRSALFAWMEDNLKHGNSFEIVAVDTVQDKVIVKRFGERLRK